MTKRGPAGRPVVVNQDLILRHMKPRVRCPCPGVKFLVVRQENQMLNQYEILAMKVFPGSVRKGWPASKPLFH